MLSSDDIARLLRFIESYHVFYGVSVMGSEVLSEEDKALLKEFDIDYDKLEGENYWETAYKFGLLTAHLEQIKGLKKI